MTLSQNDIIRLVSENEEQQRYYWKGWSAGIGTSYHTLGCSTYDDITLASADQAMQISSTDSGDTSLSVLVLGVDSNFASVSEVIALDAVDAQTPVSLVNSYYRIARMQVIAPSENAGDIYLSKDASATTAGVPDAQADYHYSMKAGDSVGAILSGYVAPSDNGCILPNYIVYSVANDAGMRCTIRFQMKKTNSSVWSTEFKFYVDERSNSQFSWRLDGVLPIQNNDMATPSGYDLRVQVLRTGAGTLNASSSISVSQKQAQPA